VFVDLPRTKRFINAITDKTMKINKVQKANALPNRPESTSAKILWVMMGVSGVVMKMIGDKVVIEWANANINPVSNAGLINGKVILRKVLKPVAPSDDDASSIAGLIC
jgi:hypothetical protein